MDAPDPSLLHNSWNRITKAQVMTLLGGSATFSLVFENTGSASCAGPPPRHGSVSSTMTLAVRCSVSPQTGLRPPARRMVRAPRRATRDRDIHTSPALTALGLHPRTTVPHSGDAAIGFRRQDGLTVGSPRPVLVTFVCVLAIVSIWLAERLTAPDDFRFSFVYIFPVGAAAWWGPRRGALACATIAVVALVGNDLTLRPGAAPLAVAWNEFTRSVTVFAVAMLILSLRSSSERMRSQSEETFRLAITDPLTGLYNRRFLNEQLARIHPTAARTRRPYALLALDLDGFKRINDTFGHAAGDAALAAFAEDLLRVIRAGDIAVRTGGDEFVVVLPEATAADATALVERLQTMVGQRSVTRGIRSVSAGVVTWRLYARIEDLLAEADGLVYESKRAGGGRVSVGTSA